MCVVAIVDADSLSVLVDRRGSGDSLLLSWIKRRQGVLAFPSSGQYLAEIQKNRAVMELMQRYEQGGQLRKIADSDIEIAYNQLQGKGIQSNDSHVLALALASEARILCSKDEYLRSDFKDKNILPRMSRRPRMLYPLDSSPKKRRDFLNRQRCDHRKSK